MSDLNISQELAKFPIEEIANKACDDDVVRVLSKSRIDLHDLAVLLSEAADKHLEAMAQRAAELTRRHFGNSIMLFTPLYISNFCNNECVYCSYSRHNRIRRAQLSPDQIEAEAAAIAASGLRHLLVLTGEAPSICTFDFIKDALKILAKSFASISIEMYPMSQENYETLASNGLADGMTIYQETYNEELYTTLHGRGPKSDYSFRLNAPERAAAAGMHAVTIGPLLGLDDFRSEVAAAAIHLDYLIRKFPATEFTISFPRMRPQAGDFQPACIVSDREYLRIVSAFRMMFPFVGITLSTRETAAIRDGMIKIAITKVSAGVSTAVGGHASENIGDTQFEISDDRSVEEMRQAIVKAGLCPVWVDWDTRRMSQTGAC